MHKELEAAVARQQRRPGATPGGRHRSDAAEMRGRCLQKGDNEVTQLKEGDAAYAAQHLPHPLHSPCLDLNTTPVCR